MVDERGKRTYNSEDEIVEKMLNNRQTDDYQLNKIQRIKVKGVTTMDKQKTWEGKGKAVPLRGLEWPRRFQEVKVLRFHDNGTGWW